MIEELTIKEIPSSINNMILRIFKEWDLYLIAKIYKFKDGKNGLPKLDKKMIVEIIFFLIKDFYNI